LVVLGAVAVRVPSAYRRHVVEQGATLTGADRACRFVGYFGPSGVPSARLIGRDEPWVQPWSDAYERFLAPEAAKPFHFGLVIPRDGDLVPEVWGWSYRTSSFWRDNGGLLRLAYRGNVATDCRSMLGPDARPSPGGP
jgi:hypothetical protein